MSASGPALSMMQEIPWLVRILAAMPPEWPEPTISTSYSFVITPVVPLRNYPLYIGSTGFQKSWAPPRRPPPVFHSRELRVAVRISSCADAIKC